MRIISSVKKIVWSEKVLFTVRTIAIKFKSRSECSSLVKLLIFSHLHEIDVIFADNKQGILKTNKVWDSWGHCFLCVIQQGISTHVAYFTWRSQTVLFIYLYITSDFLVYCYANPCMVKRNIIWAILHRTHSSRKLVWICKTNVRRWAAAQSPFVEVRSRHPCCRSVLWCDYNQRKGTT